MKMKRLLIPLLILGVVIVAAFTLNALRKDGLSLVRQDSATRDAELETLEKQGILPGAHGDFSLVSFDELERLVKSETVKSGEVLILDARPDAFFDMGHVPEAQNFPSSEVEAVYPKMKEAIAKAKRVIVYCHDRQCESSKIAAEALKAKGHGNIEVFRGGWVEWDRKTNRIKN